MYGISFRGSDCTPDFCEMLAGPHVWSGCMSGLCERQTFIGLYHHENIYEKFFRLARLMSDVVQECQTMFNFRRVSELILERKRKFLQKFCPPDFCEMAYVKFLLLSFMATDELSSLCASLS